MTTHTPSETTTESTSETPATQTSSGEQKSVTRRVVLALVLGAVLYGVLWIPSLAFYVAFQKLITTGELGQTSGGLLNAKAAVYERSTTGSEQKAWPRVPFKDLLVSLPPGTVKQISKEDDALVVIMEEGKVILDVFPQGLVRAIVLDELETTGGSPDDIPRAYLEFDEAQLLWKLTNTTPADFSFGMSSAERSLYAALVCAKLRLWDCTVVTKAFALRGSTTGGAFLADRNGKSKAIVASPHGVFVYTVTGISFELMQPRLDSWVEVQALTEDLRQEVQTEIAERYPEGHPLRVFLAAGAEQESEESDTTEE